MRTIWSAAHRDHRPAQEMIDGHLQPHVEVPRRAELVLEAVRDRALGDVVEVAEVLAREWPQGDAAADDRLAVERVHAPTLVAFLQSIWDDWSAAGRSYDALPYVWPGEGPPRRDDLPEALDARLGRWAFDAGTPITAGTWTAAWWSARAALSAARLVLGGEGAAFALCRPPGHHATPSAFGGYCYLNNSAIAAQAFRDGGAGRVAVLDVDYHHGNGTQAVFWDRPDVLTVSLHADPRQEYPYFTGHADERGGPGADGANRNYPMPWGTDFATWSSALDDACDVVTAFGPELVVVPLGVDTHEADPISRFTLRTDDYLRVGQRIAGLGVPTLFVLEGGYATDVIGQNVANVLSGFES